MPIPWYYVPCSRVSPVRDTFTMIRDVFAIRANALHGRYAALPAAPAGVSDAAAAPVSLPGSKQ